MRRRYPGALALSGAALLLLSACGDGETDDSTEGGAGEQTTIVVQTDSYALPGFEIAAEKFESENPGVTVEFQTLTADQQSTTNLQVLTSDDAPDVASAPTNTSVYTEMVKNDQFLPLDDVWEEAGLEEGYGPALADALRPQGTAYGVLFSKVLYGVAWYNKAIFDEVGIEVPEDHQIGTMENLEEIATKLREAGYQPLSIGGSSNYHLTWILDNLLATVATPEELTNYTTSFDPNVADVEIGYTAEPFQQSLARIKEMYDGQIFQDGVLGMDQDAAMALFAAGQAGMMMGHNQTPAGVADKAGSEIDMGFLFLPPIVEGATTLPNFYAGNTLEIPKNADNPELAKKFLATLMEPEMQAAAIEATDGAAPAIALPESELQDGAPAPVLELFGYDAEQGNAAGWASLVPASLGTTDPLIQELLTGGTTTEAIGEELDAELENVRAGSS